MYEESSIERPFLKGADRELVALRVEGCEQSARCNSLDAWDDARRPISRGVMRVAVLMMLVLCTACNTLHFKLEETSRRGKVISERKHFFLLGLFPTREVEVTKRCPKGAQAIEEEITLADGAMGLVTLGIYTPRTSRFFCYAGPR